MTVEEKIARRLSERELVGALLFDPAHKLAANVTRIHTAFRAELNRRKAEKEGRTE